MHRLVTFIRSPAADRWLAAQAAVWLIAFRVALWTMPFAWVNDVAKRAGSKRSLRPAPAPGRVAWAVVTAARSIPKATCLTQALAAQVMLERTGAHPEIHLGVATDRGAFEAHAWLELNGRPLVGDHELDRYARLEP